MENSTSLLRELLVACRNSIYSALYYRFDVFTKRKRSLVAFDKQYLEPRSSKELKGQIGDLCVFVYFEPSGKISPSNQRILQALVRNGVKIFLFANHKLSEEQISFFETHSIAYFERNNVGFDFGAYKDAISWLKENEIDFTRLILLNDSVFYIEEGLDDFVKGLLAQTPKTKGVDAIAAYENWGEGYHIQSFALSVSSKVAKGKAFQDFWKDYTPISNRIYAIENGEKKLSRAILKDSQSSTILYSVSDLNKKIENDESFKIRTKYIPLPYRLSFEKVARKNVAKQKQQIIDIISQTSPIHSGAYYFPKYLGAPVFKKDLVFRQRFHFWEVQDWGSELMTEEELSEFSQILRKKADWQSLSKSDLRRYKIGVK